MLLPPLRPTPRSMPELWPAPLRTLPCSPASAITQIWSPYQDRSTESVVWSRQVALPTLRIPDQTGALAAAEVSAPAMDFAQRLKSRSASRRAAPLRDRRNRNTPEHPPRCTTRRAVAPGDKQACLDSLRPLPPLPETCRRDRSPRKRAVQGRSSPRWPIPGLEHLPQWQRHECAHPCQSARRSSARRLYRRPRPDTPSPTAS